MTGTDRKVNSVFLAGAGEMGTRIHGFDWTRTPLGPIELWPQSLKTSVNLILTSRHPMWIGWGPEMTFLYNDAYLHVLGPAKHPHALGQPASEVWAEIWHVCGPLADKVFAIGEATFVDDVRLLMDRGDFLEETFYSFSYSPIRDESGQVSGLFCPSTDVTPKILNARRLRTLSELATNALVERTIGGACSIASRTLAKNSDDAPFALLYLADSEGKSAFLQQVVGDFGDDALKPGTVDLTDGAAPSLWRISEVFNTAQRQIVPVRHLTGLPSGVSGQRVAQAVVLPVTSGVEHRPYGILVIGVNPCRPLDSEHITFFELIASHVATAIQNATVVEQEKKRADMLAEIDRAKTVFFSNVSHEFRTPLTLMLGPLESLLSNSQRLSAEEHDELVIAHRNSLRLLKLVNSLLDFSRIEAGRSNASYAPTDLSRLTADLASNFRSAMNAAGLELIIDCPPLSQPVYVDPEMWEKIVLNLLSNAFKFTFEGSISVRVREIGDEASLTIADTGTGIPEAELPRIFERFHRIESVRGRTYEGTGIGLALIQELVKLHGGSISAASKPGEGTSFTITLRLGTAHLPREQVEPVFRPEKLKSARIDAYAGEALTWLAAPAAESGGAEAPHSNNPRVLVVDDNADMRDHVARILGQEYDVVRAEDGQQGLELARRISPDLVLTDIMMPRLDGFGLLQALRSDPATHTVPVIFISARAGEEVRVEGLQAGADDYLVKPFTANELRARVGAHVQMALARRRALEQESALRAQAEAARDEATQILESITDGFIRLDRDWRVTYINAEAERLNGMRREDVLGRNHWELFPAAIGTILHREFLRAASDGVTVDFENYYAPWQRWFHVKAYPSEGGGISICYEDITTKKLVEQERAVLLKRERSARQEAETLNEVAHQLAGELDLEKLIAAVTAAATKLTGADCGTFYQNVLNGAGGSATVSFVSCAPGSGTEGFGLPPDSPLLEPTFRARRVVRREDISGETGLTGNGQGPAPGGRVLIRSYLGVPVIGRSGDVLGGLFFRHSEPGVFDERSERIAAGIAAHAAIAIDNARLFGKLEQEIVQRTKVERALRESEQRFRQMIDALPAAIYTTDASGRLTHFNGAAVKLSGRVPELGSDQWWADWRLYRPDGSPLPRGVYPTGAALKDTRPATEMECIGERSDGTRFWVAPYPTPLRDEEGRIIGGINMLVDITDRKAAEEALRQSEERFRGVFDSSAVGVAVLTLDACFLQINKAFCSITGYSDEELRGANCAQLSHPDDRPEMQRLLDQLVSGEIPTFVLEKRYYTKSGRTIWVQNSVSAMRDTQGQPELLIALCEDVTGRREAEKALRESEERFRAIVETTPECVKVVAADGTLLHMNSSGLTMIGASSAADAVGKSVYDLVAPEFRDAFQDFNERICRGEKGSLEFDIIGFRGGRQQMQTHAAPFPNPDGTLAQLAVTHDISERKRAERATLLLAAIVDSSDDAIISKDLEGIITSWNKGAERLFGYTADEVVGKSITILIPPERLSEEPVILGRIQNGQPIDHFETIRRKKDGTLLNISLTVSPVRDANGIIVGASKIARDITEWKRAEMAIHGLNQQLTSELSAMARMQKLSARLVQSGEFSALLGEIIEAAIDITGADMGNIQLVEDGALKIVAQRGFDAPYLEFFETVNAGAAGCGTAIVAGQRIVVEDVASSPIFAGTSALEVMIGAGARAMQSTPLFSRSGQILGVFSTHYRSPRVPSEREVRMLDMLSRQAADVIDRKRSEAALIASETKFRQLADSMPQIVWTARPDGFLDYYNNRWYEFTGFTRDSFGETSWIPILHPEDAQRCHDLWYESVKTGQPFRIECRFWDRQERRWRWFMGRALPVRDETGTIVKWFGTCTDIDEQKRVEDELRCANHDLEQFAYSASHDLQEPLRGVKIYSELLTKRYGPNLDGEALEFLGYLRGGASRMEMLVRDLLAYTQVTKLEVPEEHADANVALSETLANLNGAIVESGARITSGALPSVPVHATHLKQLFQNLVGNAIKYRSKDRVPTVHVTAEQNGERWQFSIVDNGIGIEAEYKERIFGLFKRLHSSSEYSGTGIGLAICQRIVERYQGRIWVESKPGSGSTFKFTLPA